MEELYYYRFTDLCLGLPRWAGTRRNRCEWVNVSSGNIHPLTYPNHQSSFISFLHLLWVIASSLFNLRAWQFFCTISVYCLVFAQIRRGRIRLGTGFAMFTWRKVIEMVFDFDIRNNSCWKFVIHSVSESAWIGLFDLLHEFINENSLYCTTEFHTQGILQIAQCLTFFIYIYSGKCTII